MRDLRHVEQAEGDREPDADGCIEATEQHAEHHCVTQQVDRKHPGLLAPVFLEFASPGCTHLSRTSESCGHKHISMPVPPSVSIGGTGPAATTGYLRLASKGATRSPVFRLSGNRITCVPCLRNWSMFLSFTPRNCASSVALCFHSPSSP